MFKKFFTFFILLFLSSCFFWWDNAVSNDSVESVFENNNFSMIIPSSWEILENINETLPTPANWEIVFDAKSTKQNDDFYRNILVLKQELSSQISSLDFTIWNHVSASDEYFYIKLLSEKNVIIDSKKTKIYQFDARYSDSTPIVKFLQTWIVCDNQAFLITIAIENTNPNAQRYEWLLWSFKCKGSTDSGDS